MSTIPSAGPCLIPPLGRFMQFLTFWNLPQPAPGPGTNNHHTHHGTDKTPSNPCPAGTEGKWNASFYQLRPHPRTKHGRPKPKKAGRPGAVSRLANPCVLCRRFFSKKKKKNQGFDRLRLRACSSSLSPDFPASREHAPRRGSKFPRSPLFFSPPRAMWFALLACCPGRAGGLIAVYSWLHAEICLAAQCRWGI